MRDLVTGRSSWWRRGRLGAIAALALSVGYLAGCLPPDTVVLVQVASTLPLDGAHRLHVTLKLGAKTRVLDIPQQPVPITLPTSFTVQLGRSLGGRLDITVEARDGSGAVLASASKSIADLIQGQENIVTIDLTGGRAGTDAGTDGGTDGAPADGSVDVPALDAGVDMVAGSDGADGGPPGSGGAVGSGGSAGSTGGSGAGGRASSSSGGGGAGRVGSGGLMGSGGAAGAGGAAASLGGADGSGAGGDDSGGGRAGSAGASAGTSGAGGSSSSGGASGGGLGGGGDEGGSGP